MCGEQLPHGGVERELLSFDQLQDGGGRDGLGEARDAEQSAGLNRLLSFLVCQSEAARIHETAVLGDGERRPGYLLFLHEPDHQRVEPGQLGLRDPRDCQLPG
jgi:hypothetical protein